MSLLTDTKAHAAFVLGESRRRYNRDVQGDMLGDRSQLGSFPPEGCVWVAFQSVLQGDHSGVEVATQAHQQLLRTKGLLADDVRMVASSPLKSLSCAEGLCIDDYFTKGPNRCG